MIPFDIQRGARRCAQTDRAIAPGEEYYSVLLRAEGEIGTEVQRLDYALEAWRPPGPEAIGWWRHRAPESDPSAPKLAPNEVLLGLFDEWADQPERRDSRYVLTLLLVRKKVFRLADTPTGDDAATTDELLRVDCPKRNETYDVPVTPPGPERAAVIQAELNQLLYADGS